MSFVRNGALGVLVALFAWCALPSSGEAQYGYQCIDSTQCPAGSACVGGVCAYAQQQQGPQVQVQTGYPQQQVQVQTGYPQQQQYYAQPQYQQPPRQSHEEERTRVGMLIPGIILLAAGYASNVVVGLFAGLTFWGSSTDDWSDFRWTSLVPLVGPWVQMALLPNTVDTDNWYTWLVIDGLLQATGLALIILAVALPERVTVYSENRPGGLELALLPQAGPTLGGLSLVGRF